jgi:hypothetical protein
MVSSVPGPSDNDAWVDEETLLRFFDVSYFGGRLQPAVRLSWYDSAKEAPSIESAVTGAADRLGFRYCIVAVPSWWSCPGWQLAVGVRARVGAFGTATIDVRLPVALRDARLTQTTKLALLHALEHASLYLELGDCCFSHGPPFLALARRLDERARLGDPFNPLLGHANDTSGWSVNARAADAAVRAVQQARALLTPAHFLVLRLITLVAGTECWLPSLSLDVIAYEACLRGALPSQAFLPEAVRVSPTLRLRMLVSQELHAAVEDLVDAQFVRVLRYPPMGTTWLCTAVAVAPDGLLHAHTAAHLLDSRALAAMNVFCAGGGSIPSLQRHGLRVQLAGRRFRIRWPNGSRILSSSVTDIPSPDAGFTTEARFLASSDAAAAQPVGSQAHVTLFVCEWLPLGAAALDSVADRVGARVGWTQHVMQRISPSGTPPTACYVASYVPGRLLSAELDRHVVDHRAPGGRIRIGLELAAQGDCVCGALVASTGPDEPELGLHSVTAAVAVHQEGQAAVDACMPAHLADLIRALHGGSAGDRPSVRALLVHAPLHLVAHVGDQEPALLATLCPLIGDIIDEADVLPFGRCLVGRHGLLLAGPSVQELQPALRAIAATRARLLAMEALCGSMQRCQDDARHLSVVSGGAPPLHGALSSLSSHAAQLELVLHKLSSAATHGPLTLGTALPEGGAAGDATRRLLAVSQTAAVERALAARALDCARVAAATRSSIAHQRHRVEALHAQERMRRAAGKAALLRSWAAMLRRACRLRHHVHGIVGALCGLLAFSILDRLAGGWSSLVEQPTSTHWMLALLRTGGAGTSLGAPPWTALTLCVAAACAGMMLAVLHAVLYLTEGSTTVSARLGGRRMVVWRLQALLQSDERAGCTLHSRWSRLVRRRGWAQDQLVWRNAASVAELRAHPRAGQATSLRIEAPSRTPWQPAARPVAALQSLLAALHNAHVWADDTDARRLSSMGTVPWGWPSRGMPLSSLKGALELRVRVDGGKGAWQDVSLSGAWQDVALSVATLAALRAAVAAKLAIHSQQVVHMALLAPPAPPRLLEDDSSVASLRPGSCVIVRLSGAHPSADIAARLRRDAMLKSAAQRGARVVL